MIKITKASWCGIHLYHILIDLNEIENLTCQNKLCKMHLHLSRWRRWLVTTNLEFRPYILSKGEGRLGGNTVYGTLDIMKSSPSFVSFACFMRWRKIISTNPTNMLEIRNLVTSYQRFGLLFATLRIYSYKEGVKMPWKIFSETVDHPFLPCLNLTCRLSLIKCCFAAILI